MMSHGTEGAQSLRSAASKCHEIQGDGLQEAHASAAVRLSERDVHLYRDLERGKMSAAPKNVFLLGARWGGLLLVDGNL